MRIAFTVAVVSMLVAACGEGRSRDEAVVLPETISIMEFRPAPEGSDLLGKRFKYSEGGFSIRPPAGWVKVTRKENEKPRDPVCRVSFRQPAEKSGLEIILVKGGPRTLTAQALGEFAQGYLRELRQTGIVKIVGTDLFRFKKLTAIQVLSQAGGMATLQLLIFREPGEFLQLTFAMDGERYVGMARAIEASIESLDWPLPATAKVDSPADTP